MADKKRKGLMSLLSEYQTEKGYGGKVSGKGPVKSGKEYGKTLKQNKKEDASGPKVLAPKKPAAKKTAPKASTSKASTPKKEERVGQPAPYKLVKPTKMAPRKKRPGTGRTGEAAAKAANRKSAVKKTMTAAERRKMRLRARRGR